MGTPPPLELKYKYGFRDDLQQSASRRGVSERLADEVKAIANVPLEAAVVESIHRVTNRVKLLASASKELWLIGSIRQDQNLDGIKAFLSGGDAAKDVLRFESKSFKRVLRPSSKNRWRPVRMTDDVFLRSSIASVTTILISVF